MEHPTKMDDLGVPQFSETSIWAPPKVELLVPGPKGLPCNPLVLTFDPNFRPEEKGRAPEIQIRRPSKVGNFPKIPLG